MDNEKSYFEEVHSHFQQLLTKLKGEIEAQTDHREKCVGDRVIVWDGSWSQEKDGITHYRGNDLRDHICIVIATGEKYIASGTFDEPHNLDIVVYSPKHRKEIRTLSECVRIVS